MNFVSLSPPQMRRGVILMTGCSLDFRLIYHQNTPAEEGHPSSSEEGNFRVIL